MAGSPEWGPAIISCCFTRPAADQTKWEGDLGRAGTPDSQLEIGRRQDNPRIRRLDQNVREDRNRGALFHDPLRQVQFSDEIRFGDNSSAR